MPVCVNAYYNSRNRALFFVIRSLIYFIQYLGIPLQRRF